MKAAVPDSPRAAHPPCLVEAVLQYKSMLLSHMRASPAREQVNLPGRACDHLAWKPQNTQGDEVLFSLQDVRKGQDELVGNNHLELEIPRHHSAANQQARITRKSFG